jgi:hypothetical protein
MARTSKKVPARSKGPRVNKSAWIRSQPSTLSAKEVVEKANDEGITLSLAQVYTARSTAKRQGDPGRTITPAAVSTGLIKRGPGRPPRTTGITVSNDLQRQFLAIAVRIGTDEAQRLLERVVESQANR